MKKIVLVVSIGYEFIALGGRDNVLLLNTKNIKERVKIKRLFSLETAKLRLIKQDMKIVRNRGFLTNDIGYKSVSSIQIFTG